MGRGRKRFREEKKRKEREREGDRKRERERGGRKQDRKELSLFQNKPLSPEKREVHLSHHKTWDRHPTDTTEQQGHRVPLP